MKTRAVILAGGEGSRLGTLTAKRTPSQLYPLQANIGSLTSLYPIV